MPVNRMLDYDDYAPARGHAEDTSAHEAYRDYVEDCEADDRAPISFEDFLEGKRRGGTRHHGNWRPSEKAIVAFKTVAGRTTAFLLSDAGRSWLRLSHDFARKLLSSGEAQQVPYVPKPAALQGARVSANATASRNPSSDARIADVYGEAYEISRALNKYRIGNTATAWNDTMRHFRAKGIPEGDIVRALRKARLALAIREGFKKGLIERYRAEARD